MQLEKLEARKNQQEKQEKDNKESIKVIVKGSVTKKEKTVGMKEENREKCKEVLKSLFNKNSSADLFQNVVIKGKHLYEPHPTQRRLKNKIERSQL